MSLLEHERIAVQQIIAQALQEDVADGDATAELVGLQGDITSKIVSKAEGVICGIELLGYLFDNVKAYVQDGDRVSRGQVLANIHGPAKTLFERERLCLNLLQQLSGIATKTSQFVGAVKSTNAKIYDTRKTAPNLRPLQRYAVRAGGGRNHRYNLADAVIIKDTHVDAIGLPAIVERINKDRPDLPIMIETRGMQEISLALQASPDVILLDNMNLMVMRSAVELIGDRALTEASGNVRLDTVLAIARTGVDRISIGELTHSVRALDISMYTLY